MYNTVWILLLCVCTIQFRMSSVHITSAFVPKVKDGKHAHIPKVERVERGRQIA